MASFSLAETEPYFEPVTQRENVRCKRVKLSNFVQVCNVIDKSSFLISRLTDVTKMSLYKNVHIVPS